MGASLRQATPIIRLGHPLAFAAFLSDAGIPVEPLFRRHGLPIHCGRPDEFVPLRSAWAFFDDVARNDDPMLGWHTGRFVGDRNLNDGLLRRLETRPTLYEAFKTLIRLSSSEASHVDIGIVERGDEVLFCTQYPSLKGEPGYAQSQAYQLGMFIDLIRHFVGRQWVPERIGVEELFVTQAVKDLLPGGRILAHQRAGYVAVHRRYLHMAARRSATATNEDPLSLVQAKDFDYVDTLRAVLRAYLEEGYPPAERAASLMETSVRTLARRLSDHDLTYGQLIDDLRFDVSRERLLDGSAQISEVAASVGFSDPAHFSRMFRRMAGLSPSEFRKAVQPSATAPGALPR